MRINLENTNIYFCDLETKLLNYKDSDIHTPVMIGVKQKGTEQINILEVKNCFKTDKELFTGSQDLLERFWNSIIENTILKKKGTVSSLVYFHNLSGYDGIFLLKSLSKYPHKPIINQYRKIIKIKINLKGHIIYVLDSFLMIPYSLEKGARLFNSKNFKLAYNHNLINVKTELVSFSQWVELRKYLIQDIEVLAELMVNVDQFITNLFNQADYSFTIYGSTSLPGLVNKLFWKRYCPKIAYSNLTLATSDLIRNSYIGGSVELYKPYGQNIAELDVNSLYPYIMSVNDFPVGPTEHYTLIKDLYKLCRDKKGFVRCNIKTIKYTRTPFLVTRLDNNKIVQALGEWEGVYYTEELLYVMTTYPEVYQITGIEAFIFKAAKPVFKSFVDQLYSLRVQESEKGHIGQAMLIKRMLNSLYGRLGIKPNLVNIEFGSSKIIDSILEKEDKIATIDEVSDDYFMIQYKTDLDSDIMKQFYALGNYAHWSSAIAALARIYMDRIKRSVDVYYTDTDSIYVSNLDYLKLNQEGIVDSKVIGKLKLEGIWEEAVFISPKVYGLKRWDNDKWVYKIKMKGLSTNQDEWSSEELFNKFKSRLSEENTEGIKTSSTIFKKDLKTLSISTINTTKTHINYLDKRHKVYTNHTWTDTTPIILKKPPNNI